MRSAVGKGIVVLTGVPHTSLLAIDTCKAFLNFPFLILSHSVGHPQMADKYMVFESQSNSQLIPVLAVELKFPVPQFPHV